MFVLFDTVLGYYSTPKGSVGNWTGKQDRAEQFETIESAEKRINDFVGHRSRYKIVRIVGESK